MYTRGTELFRSYDNVNACNIIYIYAMCVCVYESGINVVRMSRSVKNRYKIS